VNPRWCVGSVLVLAMVLLWETERWEFAAFIVIVLFLFGVFFLNPFDKMPKDEVRRPPKNIWE